MDTHKNARLTPKGREDMVRAATVSRILRRLGLNKLSALEPAEPTAGTSAIIPAI